MKIISSYRVRVDQAKKIFDPTVRIYRGALAFIIPVINENWEELEKQENSLKRQNAADALIHSTKNHQAVCDFDQKFYKFPSYLRRSAVKEAMGIVSSYRSNRQNWIDGGCVGREPKLQVNHFKMPCFYKGNTFIANDDGTALVKLYRPNDNKRTGDWVWVQIHLRKTDLDYLRKYWSHISPSAPTLERRRGKYALRFAFTEKIPLCDNSNLYNGKILAVDLGLNTDAVCVVMAPDGTVAARKFIDFPADKDRLWTVLNRVKKQQREHGSNSARALWDYAKRLNDELAKKIARAICEYALVSGCHTIVFEYLDFRGRKARGSKKQRLHMWKKNGVQNIASHHAHWYGMHVSHVCAWNTSKLAFDGSGEAKRDEDNRALCTFQTGKRYNTDLNAAYNIGSRYYLRELPKPLPERERSELEAKVPSVQRRTVCTLSDLRAWYAAYTALQAA